MNQGKLSTIYLLGRYKRGDKKEYDLLNSQVRAGLWCHMVGSALMGIVFFNGLVLYVIDMDEVIRFLISLLL